MGLHAYVNKDYSLPMFDGGCFVLGDTHWLHSRLMEDYEAEARQASGRDNNLVMIERWREVVGEDDVVLHLGDLALGSKDDFAAIAAQLPGRKYMLKTGNHDKRSRAWYAEHGFTLIPELYIDHAGWKIKVTHRPDDAHEFVCYPKHLNVHGHVHSKTRGDRRLINLSVEAIDFRPVWLEDVLDERIAELSAS